MSDERLLLEWVGERFTFPDDAFDRLVRRRNRKVRNQRIASGLLAAIVSLLAIAGLLRAFADRETGDRTIDPEPRLSGPMAYQDNGLSRIARGRDLGYSWTLNDQHADPRTDPGPLPRDRGTDGHPDLDDPANIWQIGCLDRGAYLTEPRFRPSTASGCDSTGEPSSALAGCRSGTDRDGLSVSGSRCSLGRAEAS